MPVILFLHIQLNHYLANNPIVAELLCAIGITLKNTCECENQTMNIQIDARGSACFNHYKFVNKLMNINTTVKFQNK